LVGEFLNLPMDLDDLAFAIHRILGKGEEICDNNFHEEYFISDFEWIDTEAIFKVEEFDNVYILNDKINLLNELNDTELKSVKFLLDMNIVNDIHEAIEKIDEIVIYENSTMIEVAEQMIEECYDLDALPSIISSHIDYQSIARDLECEGFYHTIDSDIFYYPY